MTRDELLELLTDLEFVGHNKTDINGDVDCTFCSGRIKWNSGLKGGTGHTPECKLAAAIAWLEDLDNATPMNFGNQDQQDVWVLR